MCCFGDTSSDLFPEFSRFPTGDPMHSKLKGFFIDLEEDVQIADAA